MEQHKLRVYADTSVFGGTADPGYSEASRSFFDQVRTGKFGLVTSALVAAGLEPAPHQVLGLFEEILAFSELVPVSDEALHLQRAYLESGVVTPQWRDDALHVALATVNRCAVIVSWNFRHIVHFKKIPLYNAVNTVNGYPDIAIHSPLEVIKYEE